MGLTSHSGRFDAFVTIDGSEMDSLDVRHLGSFSPSLTASPTRVYRECIQIKPGGAMEGCSVVPPHESRLIA